MGIEDEKENQPDENVYYCIYSTRDMKLDPQKINQPGIQLGMSLMQDVVYQDRILGDAQNRRHKSLLLFKRLSDAEKYLYNQKPAEGQPWGVFTVRCDDPSKLIHTNKSDPDSNTIAGQINPIPDAQVEKYSDVTVLNGRIGFIEMGIFERYRDIERGFVTQAGIEHELEQIKDKEIKTLFQHCVNAIATLDAVKTAKNQLRLNACDVVQTQAFLLLYEMLGTKGLQVKIPSDQDREDIKKQIAHINIGINLSRKALKENATTEDILALETFAKKEAPGKTQQWAIWTSALVFVAAVALIAAGIATLGAGAIATGAVVAYFSVFCTYQASQRAGMSKALDNMSLFAKKAAHEKPPVTGPIDEQSSDPSSSTP